MSNKILLIFLLLVSPAYAGTDTTIDGYMYSQEEVETFHGMPEPSKSMSSEGTMYFDETDLTLKLSVDTGDYYDFLTQYTGDDRYVEVAGDVMTGALTVNTTIQSLGGLTSDTLQVNDNIVNFADTTDEYVLAFDVGTQTWRGIAVAGGEWTDTGTVVHPTELTDDVSLGSASLNNAAKFSIDGDADQTQFSLQMNGTQTTNPIVIEKSDGTEVFRMEGSGEINIMHTAEENDDRTFEIDTNAAGFGDVKAVDLNYITGAISAGEDEAVILINIDEIAAGGGDIFGLEVLSTEGSAGVYGMKAGATIGPIHQDSGTFANPTLGTDNTPSTNVPFMIDGIVGNTTAIFENNNEYIIIGANAAFEEIEFILTVGSSGAGIKPTYWYSTAGIDQFTQFSPVDGTNGFRNTGVIAWDASDLTGHVADTTTGKFDIKIIRTRVSLSTSPILGYAKTAATTEYLWDKNGDININSITDGTATLTGGALTGLTTPLTFPQGGTGLASWTQYLIPYADTTTSIGQIAIGTATHVLTSNGVGAAPTFQAAAGAEVNNLEADGAAAIADTEIAIGTGAGTANYAALSSHASMTNAGAVTVVDFALTSDADAGDFDIDSVDRLEGFDSLVYVDMGTDGNMVLYADTLITMGAAGDIALGDSTERDFGPNTTLKINLHGDAGEAFNDFNVGGEIIMTDTGGGLIHGSIYGNNIGWSQAAAAQNTWYNIINANIATGYMLNMTHDGNGEVALLEHGIYKVNISMTVETDNLADKIEMGIELTGSVAETEAIFPFEILVADAEHRVSGEALLDLSSGNTIEFSIRTVSVTTPTIKVHDVHMTIVQVGGS